MTKITLFYFFMSLFTGILVLYMVHPTPKVIVKYPSIDNLDKNIYEDDQGTCYSYQKEKVNC